MKKPDSNWFSSVTLGRKSFLINKSCILMRIIRNWNETLKNPIDAKVNVGEKRGAVPALR